MWVSWWRWIIEYFNNRQQLAKKLLTIVEKKLLCKPTRRKQMLFKNYNQDGYVLSSKKDGISVPVLTQKERIEKIKTLIKK